MASTATQPAKATDEPTATQLAASGHFYLMVQNRPLRIQPRMQEVIRYLLQHQDTVCSVEACCVRLRCGPGMEVKGYVELPLKKA